MTLLASNSLRLVNGEEASIITNATVPTTQLHTNFGSSDVFLNGSYKTFITTASSSNPADVVVVLPYPMTLKTVVIVNMSRSSNYAHRIGECHIVLVKGIIEVVSKTGVYDTGIYTLDTPVEADRIIIRRVAEG